MARGKHLGVGNRHVVKDDVDIPIDEDDYEVSKRRNVKRFSDQGFEERSENRYDASMRGYKRKIKRNYRETGSIPMDYFESRKQKTNVGKKPKTSKSKPVKTRKCSCKRK